MALPRADRRRRNAAALSRGQRSSWILATRGPRSEADAAHKHWRRDPKGEYSQPERLAHGRHPFRPAEAVLPIEGKGDAFKPKAYARGVRHLAIGRTDVEAMAEMVLVVVERDDRCGPVVVSNGCDDLEFEALVALADREQFTATPEKRIGSDVQLSVESESRGQRSRPVDPSFTPCHHRLRIGGPDVLVHAEHLHPPCIEIGRAAC